MKYESLVPRFIKYVKVNTRSDANSQTIPSTPSQIAFAKDLMVELKEIGLQEIDYNEKNGYVTAVLPANTEKQNVRSIGFIAHMDTADFNAEGVNPQIVKDYDGKSDIALDKDGKYKLTVKDFPNLQNYAGQNLITTDGSTLLGADDKAGLAEIMTAMQYLVKHPEIKHGKIMVAFGPDEEIGTGADHFDVEKFPVDFAYTIDGGPLGELEYETFNAAQADITFLGKNVHPGTAKNTMINALSLAIEFDKYLPALEVPEHTEGRQGFHHLMELTGNVEQAQASYIIRDHDRKTFEERKERFEMITSYMNERFDEDRVQLKMWDQYYNMGEIIEKDMSIIDLAEDAMKAVGVTPIVEPVRGGTDGSKISFMGIPTPNIFSGAENMHGRFEFVSEQTMEKATDVIIEIVRLNDERA